MTNKVQPAGMAEKGTSLPRLRHVCAEFEAVFLNHLLKTMRSSMAGAGPLGNSHQGEVLGSLLDEKIALDLAKKRGIGIADLLFEKLRRSYDASDPGKEHDEGHDSND